MRAKNRSPPDCVQSQKFHVIFFDFLGSMFLWVDFSQIFIGKFWRQLTSKNMKDLRLIKDLNLHEATAGKTGRMFGFGALSLITGLYCAELCTAALLHVIGAVSLARLASSTIFIIGFAAVSLSWALWRAYRRQRACADNDCPSLRAVGLTAIIAVAAFVVDVVS